MRKQSCSWYINIQEEEEEEEEEEVEDTSDSEIQFIDFVDDARSDTSKERQHACEEENITKKKRVVVVRFSDKIIIHHLIVWSYAYREHRVPMLVRK